MNDFSDLHKLLFVLLNNINFAHHFLGQFFVLVLEFLKVVLLLYNDPHLLLDNIFKCSDP